MFDVTLLSDAIALVIRLNCMLLPAPGFAYLATKLIKCLRLLALGSDATSITM